MTEEEKILQTYHEIMDVLITKTPSDEYGKFITYSGIHKDSPFVRIDVIGDRAYRDDIKTGLKEGFNVDHIEDANTIWSKDPNYQFASSYKLKNKNSNTDEKMRIVVYQNHVEIGIYDGKYYDCEVIYEK
ncbi:hypothetical protein AGMMS50268_02930 [Spirochaetia bacterium]|nr:hypothetical protein AGMMS50268_02930 [Spirochaetia bacterium]